MTALFTINETSVAKRAQRALDDAADTIELERQKQYLNRHRWDRNDSRERIVKSLVNSLWATQKLLRMMKETKDRELGK